MATIEAILTVGPNRELRASVTTERDKLSPLKPGQDVKVKIYTGDERSLSANALFHIWCREAAKFFKIKPDNGVKPEAAMKDVFKHQYLGYLTYSVSEKMTIKGQLRSTKSLSKGEMCHLMDNIQAWCASHGCSLSMPEDNEYQKWQEQQTA